MKRTLLILLLALPAFASAPRAEWIATATLWDSGAYGYDGAGHVTSIGTDIYRYDKASRLTLATAGTPNRQEFDYDRYGNLTSLQVTTANDTTRHGFAVIPATNQLGLTCDETVDGCFTGFYDAATGNQLGRHGAGEYVWDPLGMLAELHTSRRERYIYDANDERILVLDVVTNGERYTLRNAANKVARELSHQRGASIWTLDRDYVHRDATLIASISGTQTAPDRHYHVDHLGSTRLVTDAAAYRRAIHTYWPFGPEAPGSETDNERHKFTGHERDSSPATSPGSDLDYMHARYYDANAGRFLSVDPASRQSALRQPQLYNRYSYAMNDPLNFVDLDGEDVTPVRVRMSGGKYRVAYVDSRMVPRLQKLVATSQKKGVSFTFNNLLRTPEQQDAIKTGNTKNTKGTSPHTAGLAIDIDVASSLRGTDLAGLTAIARGANLSPLRNQENDKPHFQANDLITRGKDGKVDDQYKALVEENQQQVEDYEKLRKECPESFEKNVVDIEPVSPKP